MKRATLTLMVAIAWSTLMAFCAAPSAPCIDPEILQHASSTGDPHALQYTLDWDTSRITRDSAGSWTVTTDLGYQVRVTQGYLVALRAELVPCDEMSALDTCAALLGLFSGPGRAHAGHGDDEPDPSRLAIGQVESLTSLESISSSALLLDGPAYCQVHYLINEAYGFTEALPDDVDMIGRSLYLAGMFQIPGGDTWQPFEGYTSYSNGRIAALSDPSTAQAAFGHPGLAEVTITIIRDLGSLFDGIAMESLGSEELGDAILWNVVDHTRSEVVMISER